MSEHRARDLEAATDAEYERRVNSIATNMTELTNSAEWTPDFLLHAQAAFMEWIKMVELELGTADDWFNKVESAGRDGDLLAFGTAIGKAHGHTRNALELIRNATRTGFTDGEKQNERTN